MFIEKSSCVTFTVAQELFMLAHTPTGSLLTRSSAAQPSIRKRGQALNRRNTGDWPPERSVRDQLSSKPTADRSVSFVSRIFSFRTAIVIRITGTKKNSWNVPIFAEPILSKNTPTSIVTIRLEI